MANQLPNTFWKLPGTPKRQTTDQSKQLSKQNTGWMYHTHGLWWLQTDPLCNDQEQAWNDGTSCLPVDWWWKPCKKIKVKKNNNTSNHMQHGLALRADLYSLLGKFALSPNVQHYTCLKRMFNDNPTLRKAKFFIHGILTTQTHLPHKVTRSVKSGLVLVYRIQCSNLLILIVKAKRNAHSHHLKPSCSQP